MCVKDITMSILIFLILLILMYFFTCLFGKFIGIQIYQDKYFFNYKFQFHRLNGPSIISIEDKNNMFYHYFINDKKYMLSYENKIIIYPSILNINKKYYPYIKENILKLIKNNATLELVNHDDRYSYTFNSKSEYIKYLGMTVYSYSKIPDSEKNFTKEQINELPDFIKDLIFL